MRQHIGKMLRITIPWLILFICQLFYCMQYLLQVSISPLSFSLQHSLHISALSLGIVAASFYYAVVISSVLGGVFIDRFGDKKALVLASFSSTLGCFIFSYSDDVNMLLIARVFLGVSAAFSALCVVKIARLWFNDKTYALIIGLTGFVGTVGSMLGTSLLNKLLEFLFWRDVLFYLGLSSFAFSLLIFFLVDDPEKLEKDYSPELSKNFLGKVKSALLLKQAWIHGMFAGFMSIIISSFAALWCIPFYRKLYHTQNMFTDLSPSFIFIGMAIGSIFFSHLTNRYENNIRIIRVGTLFFLIFTSLVFYVSFPPLLMAINLFITGFFCGSSVIVIINITPLVKKEMLATVVALIRAISFGVNGVFLPILGYLFQLEKIHDKTSRHLMHLTITQYRYVFLCITFIILCALLISYFLKSSQK